MVEIVRTVSKRVNCCNIYTVGKLSVGYRTRASAPRVVGVSCNSFSVLVYNRNYVTLKILDEVVGNIVVENTANAVLIIVERDKRIAVPSLTENLGSVKSIFVLDTIYNLRGTNAVCIVGILNVVKLLELTSLFPSQVMTEVGGGVALTHYIIFEWKCQ